ncbi:MAG TPA: hypothetical protein VHF05_03570 [Candidatus Paceibacterota bacterium]|jgi:hypothetical protein|nr:hypothetical protein [Candidatus Paceibacterota bacterium]
MTRAASRIILDGFILASLLYLPWWITALAAAAGCFLFESFFEAVAFGFIADCLYGVPGRFGGTTFEGTLAASVILGLSLYLRPHLRYYK